MRGKQWIFLAPCSNPLAQKHFQDTILNGVRFESIEEYLKEDDKAALQGEDPLRIWGNTPGSYSQRKGWIDMEPGDIVLFYQSGKFTYAGKVYHKLDNERLSKKLWPDDKGDKRWNLIYFLQDIKGVDIPLSLIRNYSGYKPGFIAQRFQSMNSRGIEAILQEQSSIEGFVDAHEITSISTETDKLCLTLLAIVKADGFLDKHVDPETVRRWTGALKGFSTKKKNETYDDWISKYDFDTLTEIHGFITKMEELVEQEIDLTNVDSVGRLKPSESVVLCGFRALQRKYLASQSEVNMNPHKYSVLKMQLFASRPIQHWIFVVTDHPKAGLTAEQIFVTRMTDEFWGLGERTPNRKRLKRGDKVVFSHGAKLFLGTATLDSDSYEPKEEERDRLGHENEFYASRHGVKLAEIKIWDPPKQVNQFVENLDFIKRKDRPGGHFQGGVRAISKKDYELIVGKGRVLALIGATGAEYIAELLEFLNLKGKVWSGWTFRIKDKDCKQLNEQLAEYGAFRVYLHHIKSRGGSGKIEFIGLVDKYVTNRGKVDSPEPNFTRKDEIEWYRTHPEEKSKTWLRFIEIRELDDFIEVGKLRDYYEDTPISPSTLQNRFAPIVDEFGLPQKTAVTLDSLERAVVAHLVTGRNVIFYGPPGTGKTRKAVQIAGLFCGDDHQRFSFETANAEWTAYDVVGGPTFSGKTALKIKPGFLTLAAKKCSDALEVLGVPYWLIIDEINRANLDLAFGKIFSLLDVEYRDQPIFDESELVGMENAGEYRDITIPTSFRVLATMNTYDTALLFSLGYAFRRRFAFIEIASPFLEKAAEEKYELNEPEWRKLGLPGENQVRELVNEIDDWVLKKSYLQLSPELKENLALPKEFVLTETLRQMNEDVKDGKFDPVNPYTLACRLSEEITRRGIVEAGYAQAVDVIKYTLIYTALFSEGDAKETVVRALDEAVKAYFVPHIEYYLPRARRKMTIGEKEEEEEAIKKIQDFESFIEKLGLVRSQTKVQEIISRLKMGETRIF